MLFSDFQKDDSKTLYIIGNGFDLEHKLPTRYSDFRDYLTRNRHEHFVHQLESFFPLDTGNSLWSNFEEALGEYDTDWLYDYATDHIKIDDYDYPGRYAIDMSEAPSVYVTPSIQSIRTLFSEWIASISLEGIGKARDLPRNAKYLTFNYNLILEDIYKIPNNNVCHIHGAISKLPLIVGHNNPRSPQCDEEEMSLIQEGQEEIIHNMNYYYKNPPNNINQHKDFFSYLYDIEYIVIIGHSCSYIDWVYFKEVSLHCDPNVKWIFTPYDSNTRKNILDLSKSLKLQLKYDNGESLHFQQ